jgi:hypothetical protein
MTCYEMTSIPPGHGTFSAASEVLDASLADTCCETAETTTKVKCLQIVAASPGAHFAC